MRFKITNKITIKVMIVILGVALLAVAVWQYTAHQAHLYNMRASIVYQNLFNAMAQHDTKAIHENVMTLKKDYPCSGYTALSVLMQARVEVENKSYDAALKELNWVITHSMDHPFFQQMARIRSARILLEQKKYQAALHNVEQIDEPGFRALVDEIKGDIYAAQNNKKAANQFYSAAVSELTALHIENKPLLLKVNASLL